MASQYIKWTIFPKLLYITSIPVNSLHSTLKSHEPKLITLMSTLKCLVFVASGNDGRKVLAKIGLDQREAMTVYLMEEAKREDGQLYMRGRS